MVSPELLRRFPWFSQFSAAQLDILAMAGEEINFEDGEVIFEEGQPAQALYFLVDGCVDLSYAVEEPYSAGYQKRIPVCQVNAGEPFGISAMIAPYCLTSRASSCGNCRVVRFTIEALRVLFQQDPALELTLMRHIASAAVQRLHATRIQLAAAWA